MLHWLKVHKNGKSVICYRLSGSWTMWICFLFLLLSTILTTETHILIRPKNRMKRHYQFDLIGPEVHIQPVPRDKESAVPRRFFTAPRNSNPHNYTYIINNANKCSFHRNVFMLVIIRSVPQQLDRRMAIRETWGSYINFPNIYMPVIFVFGATDGQNKTVQAALAKENKIYHDIVQENFIDSYKNLTLKTVMAWKWARTYCPHALYVMITNDEIVVDIFKLVPYLQSQAESKILRFTLCNLFPCCTRVLRQHPKYSIVKEEYGGNAYPSYCSGTAYVAPSSVIHRLYYMSIDTPMFMPDDAWVGVLAEKLGIGFMDTYKSYTGVTRRPMLMKSFNSTSYLNSPVILGVVDYDFPNREAEIIRTIWELILHHHKQRPAIEVKKYMSVYYEKQKESDSHVLKVSVIVLVVDLIIMFFIGYIIFCRRTKNWKVCR